MTAEKDRAIAAAVGPLLGRIAELSQCNRQIRAELAATREAQIKAERRRVEELRERLAEQRRIFQRELDHRDQAIGEQRNELRIQRQIFDESELQWKQRLAEIESRYEAQE